MCWLCCGQSEYLVDLNDKDIVCIRVLNRFQRFSPLRMMGVIFQLSPINMHGEFTDDWHWSWGLCGTSQRWALLSSAFNEVIYLYILGVRMQTTASFGAWWKRRVQGRCLPLLESHFMGRQMNGVKFLRRKYSKQKSFKAYLITNCLENQSWPLSGSQNTMSKSHSHTVLEMHLAPKQV